jgi:hypothetical protein
VKALIRYELSLLLKSHRWIAPALLFVVGVIGLASADVKLTHGAGLSQGLARSALTLVPAEAGLTRSMLTAEPGAARACVAAAGGPRRTQIAALICLLVGQAAAALLNPPIVRRAAAAMFGTTGAVVLALAWNGLPANAAVRSVGYGSQERTWPAGLAMTVAVALVVVAWPYRHKSRRAAPADVRHCRPGGIR